MEKHNAYSSDKLLNTAQDYDNGAFHYGVRRNRTSNIITSARELIPIWIASARGLRFTSEEVHTSRFSEQGIDGFLAGQVPCSPQELFNDVAKYLKTYVVLPDPRSYDILTLWAIGTYVFRIFRYYPYIHVNAEKGSGKTTLMEILESICFNGDMSSDSTGAALFHEVHNNSSTLFIDEAEDLLDHKEGPKMKLLKAGFSKAGKVKRKDRTFDCYSPKMLAGINDLDDVLADRTIRIRMLRKLETERTSPYVDSAEILRWQGQLRDELYTFGLTSAVRIAERYAHIEQIAERTGLRNRTLDLWAPLLIIAEIVDEAMVPGLVEHATGQLIKRMEMDASENETNRLLITLYALATTVDAIREEATLKYYETDFVFAYARVQGLIPKGASKTWLSRRLHQQFDIGCKPVKVGGVVKRMFEIDVAKLEDLYQRYVAASPEIAV